MPIKDFVSLVKSDTAAKRALLKLRCKKGRLFCTACGSLKIRRHVAGRYRCRRCRYCFGLFTGTWWGRLRLPWRTSLWLLKLFELEVTAHQAARQVGVSYPTAHRAYLLFRRALLAHHRPQLLRREVEADESYFGGRRKGKRGRGAAGKIPVFGILERKGRVQVTVVPNVTAQTLLQETVKMVRRGTLVYTDKYKGYDTLAFCGYRRLAVNHQRRYARGKVHINGLEGFWSYAKGKLLKHHGVSPAYFPLYLFEMEFRYNQRREDLFVWFLKALLQPVEQLPAVLDKRGRKVRKGTTGKTAAGAACTQPAKG